MAKSKKKYLKKKKEAQMEAKFFKYAILATIALLIIVVIWSNIGN